jgi:ABC-type siderophore export system fused ATPase/permease subunit
VECQIKIKILLHSTVLPSAHPSKDFEVTASVGQSSKGQILGLLGRTGSGKTTLTRLLLLLYDPTGETIRLGGVALSDVPLADLRQQVGMVTQEIHALAAVGEDSPGRNCSCDATLRRLATTLRQPLLPSRAATGTSASQS